MALNLIVLLVGSLLVAVAEVVVLLQPPAYAMVPVWSVLKV
jgi:hypothetical protein